MARVRDTNPNHPREGRARRVLKYLGLGIVGLLVIGVAAFGILYVATPIPAANAKASAYNTHLYFADGSTELGTLSVQNREYVPFASLPKNLTDAVVAAENPTFWTDPGIAIDGLARAAVSVFNNGLGDAAGGSTITQQYVKNVYLSADRTITRKARELVIALKVGQERSKQDILEGYLNTVYYGRGAYGIGAAAKAYFDVDDVSKLTLQQSVVLASVINAPGKMDPAQGAEQAQNLLERYQYTLNQMVKTGKLTDAQKAAVYTALPAFGANSKDPRYGGTNGYLMKMVESELKGLGLTDAQINGGGLAVTTTFDKAKQDTAVAVAQAQVKGAAASSGQDASKLHASLVSIDNATGAVLAVYGGNDYVTAPRNWATTTAPTGSTFKTWELTAALRQGFSMDQQLKGYTHIAADGKQITGETDGMVSLQEATTTSNNAAFVDLASMMKDAGNAAIKAANDAGIPGKTGQDGWNPDIRIGMGTAQVSPLQAAAGYATLANDGVRVTPHVVAQVKDATGAVIYTAPKATAQGIEKDIATKVTSALQEVATSGTGRKVGDLGWPVAGKTGTRYDGVATRSSWFVGYTKQITTAVNFRAGDSGNEPLDPYSDGFYGAGYPASTWLNYMQQAMKGLPQVPFTASGYTPSTTAAAPTQTAVPAKPTQTAAPSTATAQPTQQQPTKAPARPTQAASPTAQPTSKGNGNPKATASPTAAPGTTP